MIQKAIKIISALLKSICVSNLPLIDVKAEILQALIQL